MGGTRSGKSIPQSAGEPAHGLPFNRVSLSSAANEPGFYQPEVERKLAAEVESPANVAIDKLRGGQPIDARERADLAFYMATTLKRVPAHRKKARRMAPAVLAEVLGAMKRALAEAGRQGVLGPDALAARLAEADAIADEYSRDLPREVIEQINAPWPSQELVC